MGTKFEDDLLLTPAMRERLDLEAVPDHCDEVSAYPWFAWLQRSNGDCQPFANQKISPIEQQKRFTLDLLRGLNFNLRHSGAWVTGCVLPAMLNQDIGLYAAGIPLERTFSKAIAMWLDEDGDVQFTMEIVEPMVIVEQASMEGWIEQAEEAWQSWYENMRVVLAPTPDQLYKRAQGQRRPSSH